MLNVCIGCLYLLPMRMIPVWDLPNFYYAAQLVRAGQASELYNKPAYEPLVAELRKTDGPVAVYSYFNRPAFAALLFLPLAYFSYRTASNFVIALNFALLGLIVWKLPTWLRGPKDSWIWLMVFMPFLYSIPLGQDTLLLTLIVAGGLTLAWEDRDVLAGVLLALGAFKPHLIWAIPIALAASKRWKMLYAFLATGAMLTLLSLALVGTRGFAQWIDLLRAPTTDAVPYLMGNVRAIGLHWGTPAAILAALVAVVSFGLVLKRGSFTEKFAAALFVGLLLSPHTYLQDYSLLAIPALVAPHPVARYLLLLPWPYFYRSAEMLPLTVVALLCLASVAARPLLQRLPSWAAGRKKLFTSLRAAISHDPIARTE